MSFQELDIKPEYRSLIDNIVYDFYEPILSKSVLYKRAVGFFSSSSLIELTNGIKGLLKNDGKIEMIASPRLSPEDIQAIEDGFERRNQIIEECLLRELRNPSGKFEETRLNLLSNLIAAGKLELKIALLESNNHIGLFHEKLGLMYDGDGNVISFTGSMNESANAFSINYESIDVFKSWTSEENRVKAKIAAFTSMWNDTEPNIKVLSFPNVEKEIITKYKITNIDDYDNYDLAPRECTPSNIEPIYGPHIPENVKIRPYQNDAIQAWEKRNFKGIFDMATGTGKTYTALLS